jgi:hypothetical protein
MDGLENFMGCAVHEFFFQSSLLSIEMEFLGLHTESHHMNQFMGNNVKKERPKQKGRIIPRGLQDSVILKTNPVKFFSGNRRGENSLLILIFTDLRQGPSGFFLPLKVRQCAEIIGKSFAIS